MKGSFQVFKDESFIDIYYAWRSGVLSPHALGTRSPGTRAPSPLPTPEVGLWARGHVVVPPFVFPNMADATLTVNVMAVIIG